MMLVPCTKAKEEDCRAMYELGLCPKTPEFSVGMGSVRIVWPLAEGKGAPERGNSLERCVLSNSTHCAKAIPYVVAFLQSRGKFDLAICSVASSCCGSLICLQVCTPCGVRFHHGIETDKEFAHTCDEGDHLPFSTIYQSLIEVFHRSL